MTVSVDPTNKRNTHHVSLTDGVTTMGLILSDLSGSVDKYQYQRRALPARAIKFTQGEQEYSDLEPPWTDIAQKDWGAGFGYHTFDENRAGYYDGQGVDTTGENKATLGPMVSYATGVRNWAGTWPNVVFNSTYANNYVVVHFTPVEQNWVDM